MKFTSYFSQRVQRILEVYLKDSNKRARNMKFTSIFFTASETCSIDNGYQAAEAENPCNTNKKSDIKLG